MVVCNKRRKRQLRVGGEEKRVRVGHNTVGRFTLEGWTFEKWKARVRENFERVRTTSRMGKQQEERANRKKVRQGLYIQT